MSLVYRIVYKIPVTGGTLSVEKGLTESQWRQQSESYGVFFDGDYKLRYFNDMINLQLNDLEELLRRSREFGFDIESEIQGNPLACASWISAFLHLPFPLPAKSARPPGYYEREGIDPDALQISISDGVLRWHGLESALPFHRGETALFSFKCTIKTLKVDVTKRVLLD